MRRLALTSAVALLLAPAAPIMAHSWYSELLTPAGASCCNDHDCRPVRHRYAVGGVEIHIDGQWVPVQTAAVLSVMSPDTSAHACYIYVGSESPWEGPWSLRILCVVLPGMS